MLASSSSLAFLDIDPNELTLPYEAGASLLTGSANIRVPFESTDTRAGFTPRLSLYYDSSAGNSPYGLGWSLSGVLTIAVDTRESLPKYNGEDNFVFTGAGELVPALINQSGQWIPQIEERGDYWVRFFRGKVENSHIRVEQWIHKISNRIHWQTRDVHNVVTVYGFEASNNSRIADPNDYNRVFAWLPEIQYDSKGNVIRYEYVSENGDQLDLSVSYERSRSTTNSGFAQRYLKRIYYGNTHPLQSDETIHTDNKWLFEVVLDYGDHTDVRLPIPTANRPWLLRPDPFSTYRPGFEVRTYRLCRRVLLFHQFDELDSAPVLVGEYRLEHNLHPEGTTLGAIYYTGHRESGSAQASSKSLPPLRFTYSTPSVAQTFKSALAEELENVPSGLSDFNYRWIDLYGEGLPGILTEMGQAWYFKANEGNGHFGLQELVVDRPAYRLGQYAFSDFDSDGNVNLVVLHGRQGGFYEFNRDRHSWDSFRPFPTLPHLEAAGTKAQWLDLTGDGRADLILADPERLTWYPSLGKEGFGAAIEVQRPQSPQLTAAPIAEDLALDYFFADMNGDGLLDQVLIRNGRVEYWPQLGYGRFGDPILMENSPIFAPDAEFDASRLLLTDLDGNGSTDLIYVGSGEIRYWLNAGGNQWIEGGRIGNLPYIDNLSTLRILDFLGDGTPCLVWSSPLAGRVNAIQYLPLTSGVKPRLLLSVRNLMGSEVTFSYSTSATHYLRDKRAGRSWRTKIPSHPVVVDQMATIDHIGGSRVVTRYEYHDGYFDSQKRAFQGFALIDQYDTEVHDATSTQPEVTYTTPACQRTWFHIGVSATGMLVDSYRGDPEQIILPAQTFENAAELGSGEYEEGLRSLAGSVIRQEVFAVNPDGSLASHPFQITQNSYRLRRLQPSQSGLDACFMYFMGESITYNYEQQANDPRVSHDLTFDVDAFGNILQNCSVTYSRRSTVSTESTAQQQILVSAQTYHYINIERPERYELGIPVETQAYEVVGLVPGATGVFEWDSLRQSIAAAIVTPLAYDQDFSPTGVQSRLITWERTFYWNDTLDTPLPLGSVGIQTLLHHTESACFTTTFINQTFGARIDTNQLRTEGRYQQQDGYWWQPSDTYHYQAASGFFQLARLERLDGGVTTVTYDPYALTIVEIQDALGNRIRGEIDYHLLAPHRITDPNNNIAEVLYDPLGVVIVSSIQGQVLDTAGNTQTYGHDRLSIYTPRPNPTFADVLANPAFYLQNSAQFVFYELDAWTAAASPPRMITLVREEFTHDGSGGGNANSRIQIEVSYFDGFHRVLQSKTLAEPGPALQRDASGNLVLDSSGEPVEGAATERWLVTGHTVYNRKQQPIRQYEPFYSTVPTYESEIALAHFGVFHQFQYDAVGRPIREDFPNGTHTRTEFKAWEVRHFDPNDTVLESNYRNLRNTLTDGNLEKTALRKAEAHANTPTVTYLDARGLEVKQVAIAADGNHRVTETIFDIRGNTIAFVDPRGLTAFRYRYDMLDRPLFEHSIDAGDRWTLLDIFDRVIHQWDARDVHQRFQFDQLDRPTSVFVDGALGLNQRTEQMIYGEDPSIPQAQLRNLRGKLFLHRDQAGTVTVQHYDLTGQALRTERQLRQDYKSESNWTTPAAVLLEPTRYETHNQFDAIGRIRRQFLPDGTTREMEYLRGGGLNRVVISSDDGVLNNVELFSGSDFNARGQRSRALLGNGVEIVHQFDPETFRTDRITARRLPRTVGGTAITLQDIEYTYDPVGNIIYSVDNVQQPTNPLPVIQGLSVSAASDYTYDAFYQLIRTTGRVHQALLETDYRPGQIGPGHLKGTRHLTFNNGAAVERYTRTYEYDLAGNRRRMSHQGLTRNWTTDLWISPTSNRSLPALDLNDIPITNPESRFDANGNVIGLPHLRQIDWNYRNAISRAVIIDRSAEGNPDDTEYYVYDGNGLRIRKVTERLVAGQVEITEKIYLDGSEIKRIRRDGNLQLERITSHISDGVNRIALVHRWTQDTLARETDDVTQPRIRYQLTNHLGSSQMELDEQGGVISYEEYFPFGGSAFIAGDNVREVEMKDYRFCGKERDEATGFYYFEYRYYAPWIGNWLSPDPIGPEDNYNLYCYVFNNPINLTDPDGLQATATERGRLRHGTYTAWPADVVRAWNGLSGERRAELQRVNEGRGPGWYRSRDGRIDFGSSAEIQAIIEQHLAAGENVTIMHLAPPNPDAEGDGSGTGPEMTDEEIEAEIARLGVEAIVIEVPASGGADESPPGDAARGADGSPADDQGTSGSGNSGVTGTHDAGGSSTPTTPPADSSGSDGSGARRGRHRGGSSGGGGGSRPGTGTRAPGSGRGQGTTPGSGIDDPLHLAIPSPYGIPGGTGVPGGVPGGVQGGIPGSTGTELGGSTSTSSTSPPGSGTAPPPGQTLNGDDPNGSPTGSPTGTRTGSRDGQGGTTPNGTGSRREGSPQGSSSGQAGGSEGQSGQPTTMDRITQVAGYWNLEFGESEGGESGGIPGGMGSHRGAGLQALYVGLVVVDIVLTFISLGGFAGIKAGLKALLAAGRRLLTRAATAVGALFTRQFWRIALTRLGRFFFDPRTFRTVSREYWRRFGPASGRSLHHWLIPQRWTRGLQGVLPQRWGRIVQGISNGGWNLLELPRVFRFGRGGLNEWMGFWQMKLWSVVTGREGFRALTVVRGGAAHLIENFIRLAIPGSLIGGAYGGYRLGEYLSREPEPQTNPRTTTQTTGHH